MCMGACPSLSAFDLTVTAAAATAAGSGGGLVAKKGCSLLAQSMN